MNLGVAYYRLGKPSESLVYCTKAKNFFDKMNDILSLARIHTNLGLCNLALHNCEEAEHNFLSAIDLYTELGDQAWRVNAMDGLGMTYIATEQYGKAIQVFQQALTDLQVIKSSPYFDKFYDSLTTHIQETYQNNSS